jgi:hypothetical protein
MRGDSEQMPPHMQILIKETLGAPRRSGFQLNRAQYARTGDGGIWVVTGKNMACLVQAVRGAMACDVMADVIDQGLLLVVYKPPKSRGELPSHFLALGLAPDWARAVRLRIGSNTIRNVAVRGNAYALRAERPIRLERLEDNPVP